MKGQLITEGCAWPGVCRRLRLLLGPRLGSSSPHSLSIVSIPTISCWRPHLADASTRIWLIRSEAPPPTDAVSAGRLLPVTPASRFFWPPLTSAVRRPVRGCWGAFCCRAACLANVCADAKTWSLKLIPLRADSGALGSQEAGLMGRKEEIKTDLKFLPSSAVLRLSFPSHPLCVSVLSAGASAAYTVETKEV